MKSIIDLKETLALCLRIGCSRAATLVMWLVLVENIQAQDFTYTVNNSINGTDVTITGYIGPGGNVTIPSAIDGMPVTIIGSDAFYNSTNLTSVTIPNSVTVIGDQAFLQCTSLTNLTIPSSVTLIANNAFQSCMGLSGVTIPNSVTLIGSEAFVLCTNLTAINVETNNPAYSSVSGVLFNRSQTTLIEYPGGKVGSYSIPNSVISIGDNAFYDCTSLTSVTIPSSVTSIGDGAFTYCFNLNEIYFRGNAPRWGPFGVFYSDYKATAYYLPGTTGWGPFFSGIPTALWTLPYPLILTFGIQTNQFGFTVSWATNLSVVVEAATDLANPVWSPLATNSLTGGSFYFSDPQWKNYPTRFYRIRSL